MTFNAIISRFAVKNGVMAWTDPTTGYLTIQKDGGKTAMGSFNLGTGADSPIVTDTAVYAASPANQEIAKFDLSSSTLSLIQAPGYNPALVAEAANGEIYALANLHGDSNHSALLHVTGTTAANVASADGFTSIEAAGGRILWTAPSSDGKTSKVYAYNALTSTMDAINALSLPADTLVALPGDRLLAYHIGSTSAAYLDSHSYAQDGIVTFPTGLLLPNRGLVTVPSGELKATVAMSDGSIRSVDVQANQPDYSTLSATSAVLLSGDKEQLLSGFSLEYLAGVGEMMLAQPASAGGQPSMQVRTVPLFGVETKAPIPTSPPSSSSSPDLK